MIMDRSPIDTGVSSYFIDSRTFSTANCLTGVAQRERPI
jgi:hypothetical protein